MLSMMPAVAAFAPNAVPALAPVRAQSSAPVMAVEDMCEAGSLRTSGSYALDPRDAACGRARPSLTPLPLPACHRVRLCRLGKYSLKPMVFDPLNLASKYDINWLREAEIKCVSVTHTCRRAPRCPPLPPWQPTRARTYVCASPALG